jgi:transcriptional regulator with XRE-family HTH domain
MAKSSSKTPQKAELSQFLQSRRARIQPERVGLSSHGRRRAPGLRREELAQLANVGLTWYTWLEQGRNVNASDEVLMSIAQALQLTPDEQAYLFALARSQHQSHYPIEQISPTLQRILDDWQICPAYVTNSRWDIIAWNSMACRVFCDFAALSPQECNILCFLFQHPLARKIHVDWEQQAKGAIALFRASTEQYIGEAWLTDFVNNLQQQSSEFQQWWTEHEVQAVHSIRKELNHPEMGWLVLQPTTLYIADSPNLRLMVYTPVPEADTVTKLAKLLEGNKGKTASPGELFNIPS